SEAVVGREETPIALAHDDVPDSRPQPEPREDGSHECLRARHRERNDCDTVILSNRGPGDARPIDGRNVALERDLHVGLAGEECGDDAHDLDRPAHREIQDRGHASPDVWQDKPCLHELAPELDRPNRGGPGTASWKVELVPKVVIEVAAMADDVRPMHREHGVALTMGLGWEHPVREHRNQTWRRIDEPGRHLPGSSTRVRAHAPVL